MVKLWDIKVKHDFFLNFVKNLASNISSIATLKLFKSLVKEQKEKINYSYTTSPVKASESTEDSVVQEEFTLNKSLKILNEDHQLPMILLDNLANYCKLSKQKTVLSAGEIDRKKTYLVNPKYSHHEEIDERLSFIKFLGQQSPDYQVSKAELDILYKLLVTDSQIPSDQGEFLTWCKSSCELSTATNQILDLNQVGEFFSEKMNNGSLDVKNLPEVGFDFLQQYFLTVNESSQKLIKSQVKKQEKATSFTYNGYGYLNSFGGYGPMRPPTKKQDKDDQKAASFKILKHPHELDKLEIVWNIALQCMNPPVVQKAIDFLIKVYYCVDEDLNSQKISIQDDFIQKCMDILKSSQDEHTLTRALNIIKSIIVQVEKKGTSDVRPHSSLLKGELLEKIIVKNKASPNISQIVVSLYSNTTFWEFKRQIAEKLSLAPKYLKLIGENNKTIKDTEHGKTLVELGFYSHIVVQAEKIQISEDVPNAPLIGSDGKLSEKAAKIFNEWFTIYSNEDDKMTQDTCALFIQGCTGEKPPPNDERIQTLFKTYDSNNDGFIERSEFITFYENASRQKPETVRENLRHHNIRADLKKLSEIQEEVSFQAQDMPRLKISKNEEYFDLLMSLLDKSPVVSASSWNLIQMLATSPQIYKRVLQLQSAKAEGSDVIDWAKFFDSNSVYKLLYTLQIVEAVMEEGEGEGLEKFDIQDNSATTGPKKPAPVAPPLPGAGILPPGVQAQVAPKVIIEEMPSSTPEEAPFEKSPKAATELDRKVSILAQPIIDKSEDDTLKSQWTAMFLKGNGFQYILKVFMGNKLSNDTPASSFELKHMAFLLKLLRIFIMAAFSTTSESSVYETASLLRRSSSTAQEDNQEKQVPSSEGSRFKQLQELMAGPIGVQIIEGIDYHAIVQRILTLASQILTKEHMILEDKLIIENALNLLVGCILHKNELLNSFYEFKSDSISSSEEFILHGLLYTSQDKIREEFKESLSCLSQKLSNSKKVKEAPLFYLLRVLSGKFSIISEYQCNQYFELFCELIDQYFLIKSIGGNEISTQEVFNPEHLLSQIIDKIKEYNQLAQQKNSDSSNTQDQDIEGIYIGLIQLTGKIIDNFDIKMSENIVEQKNLIDEIFVNFLFASVFQHQKIQNDQSDALVKIKPKRLYGEVNNGNGQRTMLGKNAKDAAYKLLNNLIKKSPLLMNAFLEKSISPLMSLIKRHDGWNYQPPSASAEGGHQKYCGLKNLGCICYMNAMMQQFFMVPAFRYNLLSVDDGMPEDIQEYKGKKIDDNVFHQLQKLIAHLELSDRSDYNPFEFCFAFKDFEGNPTNTSEQKDAQEFLNMAFDRIEDLLRTTSRKYLMQSVFGGQTCSQVVCLECGTCKNRIEDFYNLSLTVKDIKSMADSLQKQIEGEIINGFQCDTCNKKVDISKRMLLSAAPNVLIVHLQRIVFNFDTFQNSKINSFFEFPYHLDLKPYSFYDVMDKEGRLKKKEKGEDEEQEQKEEAPKENEDNQWPEEETCWEYKLVGVIVHSGTANAGHYWSYINTKRGHAEPESSDPNWSKTENDTWMEFNDSTVRNFNFEKMKDECFGGDGGNSYGGDSWSFGGGNSGKSAYMLVYERREKKPIKVLVPPEEAKQDTENTAIQFDPKKEEYFKLLDYKRSVEEILPSKIYRQVFEDNQKFEFDNDIYSQEFFDFIKGILLSVKDTLEAKSSNDSQLLSGITKGALQLGKKAIMDLLAKSFHNGSIKQMTEALISIMKEDESLCITFLQELYNEDKWTYLLEILLECTDATARTYVSGLIKFIVIRLRYLEADKLFQTEKITETDEKTGAVTSIEQPAAIVAQLIMKFLSLFNTQVAKNWSRFEHFLDIIHSFACGQLNNENPDEGNKTEEEMKDKSGLVFLLRMSFVQVACDFMLGKKSPLCLPGEKRFEMGGSFTTPNFTPITKILTKILTDSDLLVLYPLNENERKMFLHADLLKVMLSSPTIGKQFGQCLATMCRDNKKLSKKVSKVLVKAINNSNFDNVKTYLSALKSIARLKDSLKEERLEWIFGFPQVINRKNYREERFKYGVELVDRMNEESNTYISPIGGIVGSEDSLFSQLLKCKGKLDTFAINCLKEMLSLMAKDEDIARYVYFTAPNTYQVAHFSDWIRPYIEYQKAEVERSNSMAYFKGKHESLIKCLDYLNRFENNFVDKFKNEELDALNKAHEEDPSFREDIRKDWLAYEHDDVYEHFPPQIIIGKQTQDDIEVQVHDEDPLVKVTLSEVVCEYNYSNPQGFFNLSIPHIEIRSNNYTTISYAQYMQNIFEQKKAEEKRLKALEEEEKNKDNTNKVNEEDKNADPQDEQQQSENQVEEKVETMEPPVVRSWFECKREGSIILKLSAFNKSEGKIKVSISLSHDLKDGETPNVVLPKSEIIDTIFRGGDSKVLLHLTKIYPNRPWTGIKISVVSVDKAPSKTVTGGGNNGQYTIRYIDSNDVGTYPSQGGSGVTFVPDSQGICMVCAQVNLNNTTGPCNYCQSIIPSTMEDYFAMNA